MSDRVLSEEQMSELLGGIKCPYCGAEFPESMDIKPGMYYCEAKNGNVTISGTIEANSAYHAEIRYYNKYVETGGPGQLTDVHCRFYDEYGGY